ncbi:MAG: hypothetical protein HZA20_07455 [Nitrospirae bacterium]|nr:hypothetical protein [Nitrospirota bacterium]
MEDEKPGEAHLSKQLELLPHALVVALGGKAQKRLRSIGFTEFLPAFAAAPPGCNFAGAKESWEQIPIELRYKHDAQQTSPVGRSVGKPALRP